MLTLALVVGFFALTWFAAGPLKTFQIDQSLNRVYPAQDYRGLLITLDRIGQRAVCLPVLAVVVAFVSARHRSARPVLVALVAVLAINLVVWVLKIWLGRGTPIARRPAFFIEGQMYPSGHAANVIVVYGLCAYLIVHYTVVSLRTRQILALTVGALMVVMTTTSMLLRWHWLTDLIAGYLIGGAVLACAVAIDAAVPFRSRRLVVVPPAEQPGPPPAPIPATQASEPDTAQPETTY